MRTTIWVAALFAVFAVGTAIGMQEGSVVTMVQLPLELPAVGNLEDARRWRFGRLEQVQRSINSPDVQMGIRTADGSTHQIVGPIQPLAELARRSNWVQGNQTQVGSAQYAERMIAFDADENGRLIAVISMEPMEPSRARLSRAVRRGPAW